MQIFLKKKKKEGQKLSFETITISFLCIHLKSINQADEIRTVFNKIIYRKKKSVLCFYFSLISHSNYSCYGTFIALFYRKVFGARGKEISLGIGRNVFPHLGAAKSLLFGEVMRKEKSFSATRN